MKTDARGRQFSDEAFAHRGTRKRLWYCAMVRCGKPTQYHGKLAGNTSAKVAICDLCYLDTFGKPMEKMNANG